MNVYNARTLYLGSSGRLFASCWAYPANEGMFFSTNGGLNWQQSFFGAANDNVFSIAAKNGDSMVFVGTRNGVYRSFNNGAWIQLMSGMPVNSRVRDLAISPEGYIAAATSSGVYISTNQGNQWQPVAGLATGDTAVIVSFIDVPGEGSQKELKTGTDNGKVYKSTDAFYTTMALAHVFDVRLEVTFLGSTAALLPTEIIAFFPSTPGIGGVAASTDGGNNYNIINEGLPDPAPVSAASMTTSGNILNLYTGFFLNQNGGAKIYKRTSVIGIHSVSTEVPSEFSLSQNFPNPFNPVTNIEFAVPKAGFVKLAVYDITGMEIETLASGQMSAGTYKADWNASGYSSGVYFYKLESGGFTETRKMILVK
jgi:hypothetical protein